MTGGLEIAAGTNRPRRLFVLSRFFILFYFILSFEKVKRTRVACLTFTLSKDAERIRNLEGA